MAASDMRSYMMVVEAAAQIVSHKLDILLSHPVCIECLLIQARAKDAKAKLAKIQEFFSTQNRPSKTTEWSERLLRAMYYAEEFIDKFHLRDARERHEALHMTTWPLTVLISKYKLCRDLSILVNKMEGLCDDKFLKEGAEGKREKGLGSSSSQASVPWHGNKLARLTSFWDRYEPIFSFSLEEDKKKIMERIRDESKEIQGTSIWGEPGTGKTILARWAYSQVKHMKYECRAWVRVSVSMDKQEFLREILKQVEKLVGETTYMDIEEIKKMLLKKLAETKRFLIVLDDVQQSNEPFLRELVMSIPFPSQGHIITTTQDNKIATYMDTTKAGPIRLGSLDVKQSQSMLAQKLHGVRDEKRLSNEERDILNMCHCSPLYISLLGRFLLNVEEHERATLVKEGSIDILQLSCHKLPIYLKPCFIYMALFPVASAIPTRRLVRLWLAEGLLDSYCYDVEREKKRLPEDVGETFILELANRNMIHVVSWRADGSPKACRMVTSLYDMIRPIAMSMGFLHIHATGKLEDRNDRDPTNRQQQLSARPRERTKIRWLAEHTNVVTDVCNGSYPDLNLGRIQSFLSFYLRRGMITKDINTFLKKMTSHTNYSSLRVLDLEGMYKPSLQGVLHKLVLLRYLGLRSTALDLLPSAVADLHHLETLDIKHTNITSLPSSFWKARNLRHLYLNWFYIDLKNILKVCSNNVNALTQLQNLSGLVIGEVKRNLMGDLMGCLTTLTTLKLFLQHSDKDTSGIAGEMVANWISFGLTHLQSLTFGVIQEAKPAEGVQPAESTNKLATSRIGPLPKLSLAEKHDDLLELYLLGQLNKPIWAQLLPGSLRVLTLSGSKVETNTMIELGGLLRNLKTLKLLANSLQGTSLAFVKGGFPSLKILKIWRLPELKEVHIDLGAMLHLRELEFRCLEKLETVEGIDHCTKLETLCLISQSETLAKTLKDRIKEKNPNVQIDAKKPESMHDDEDDRDERGGVH